MTARASPNGGRPGPPPQTVDWDAAGYQRDPSTPTPRCWCGGMWIDDEPGRHAHRVVFLHQPKAPEPRAQESTEGESR